MKHVRLALEILGVALYVAAHFGLVWIYGMGSTLRGVSPIPYWTAIGGGYLVMLVLASARPAPIKKVPRRRAFDAWLVAALSALVLCTVSVVYRWPLEFAGWDAHGLGAEGGEVNAAFFPWLHAILWVLFVRRTSA